MIAIVAEDDLPDLLRLMRGYCDFYEVAPADEALLAMSRVLIEDPERQGLQLIARDDDGQAVGFATIFWTWSTLSADRLGVMNDLFVSQDARGGGVADALIAACADQCRDRGVPDLAWQTAKTNARALVVYARVGAARDDRGVPDLAWQTAKTNARAQVVYERVGATRDDRWLDYSLSVAPTAQAQ